MSDDRDDLDLGLPGRTQQTAYRISSASVGFDDIPESAYFLLPLTPVREDFGELGRRASATLVDMINASPRPVSCLRISARLVPAPARPRQAPGRALAQKRGSHDR
jgi:DNA-binding LacI/PurR family transcriptional regulator